MVLYRENFIIFTNILDEEIDLKKSVPNFLT
jgi:hypothetical protein